jgi:hypothetical protein
MSRHALAGLAIAASVTALAISLGGCASRSTTSGSGGAGSGAAAPGTSSTSTAAGTSSVTTTGSSPSGMAQVALTVTPATGRPDSVFTFSFRAPAASGRQGSMQLSYGLSVTSTPRSGCVARHGVAIPPVRQGQAVGISLGPAQVRGHWCVGTYSARVEGVARPVCTAGEMCPQFIRLVAVAGPASFRIAG